MKKQFLNMDDLCHYLMVSKSNIYKKVARKEIPFHKIGKRTLFDIDEINNWVKQDGVFDDRKELSILNFKPFLD